MQGILPMSLIRYQARKLAGQISPLMGEICHPNGRLQSNNDNPENATLAFLRWGGSLYRHGCFK